MFKTVELPKFETDNDTSSAYIERKYETEISTVTPVYSRKNSPRKNYSPQSGKKISLEYVD